MPRGLTGKVSIVMPIYNEALAVGEILRRVFKAPLPPGLEREVIVVDDGSSDRSLAIVQEFVEQHPEHGARLRVHAAPIRHGKAPALRAGFRLATGDLVLVQDGDLEYNPDDYGSLLSPFADPGVEVVYGSRFLRGIPRGMRVWNLLGNLTLSLVTRLLFRCGITDEATGYKVFRRRVLDRLTLTSGGFAFCPEFTGKVLRLGIPIVEVPVRYEPRGVLAGKKIRAVDGLVALYWLFRVRLARRSSIAVAPTPPRPGDAGRR